MDVGTVSSDDVIRSYKRQLAAAHEQVAMLEAALFRLRREEANRSPTLQVAHDEGLREATE